MAKFSQAFLERMGTPGLFEQAAMQTAGQIAGIPALARQQQEAERQRQMAMLEASGQQMADQATALANRRRNELLMKQAIQAANRAGDTEAMRAIGLGALDPAEYIRTQATAASTEKNEIIQGTPGTQFFTRDKDGNLVLQETVPFKDKEEKPVDKPFELVKTGKYTPESIQDAVQADGSINYDELDETTESQKRGSVGSNVEKRNNEISAESTKASIGLARNRQLQQKLITTGKTTGILSDLRTSVLDIAGKRDEEEEAKTAFLRTRNTDIINSLPPGVASDTDVRIFSQGFPAANASKEEILRYLQAEERVLAAASDIALVADRHLAYQINAGLDATMVGFEDKKQQYGVIMQKALRDIEEKTAANPNNAVAIEQEVIKQVSEVLGFVPKFYR